jgi:hypothetical protein
VTAAQASIIYAEEADVLNVAMFGQTAKQWREAHPELKGNIRDYASINSVAALQSYFVLFLAYSFVSLCACKDTKKTLKSTLQALNFQFLQ